MIHGHVPCKHPLPRAEESVLQPLEENVKRLAIMLGGLIGGSIGSVVGSKISFFTGFMLGTVGTGVGMYMVIRWSRAYF